ncbi:hypothetical protein H7S74_22855 [Priestia aryabhattai]|uniref:hypothetical protein n=1 Tax=Priestia aryabhattai TaxID=412384 RepID=UPI001EC806A5|nr:hypothetical protein [Priestia aryabhattai]MBY0091571.1 hypothetical protein [Priestia aryabhattai]MBY0104195.1 hypothetical protein [Priestia aryabhattai]
MHFEESSLLKTIFEKQYVKDEEYYDSLVTEVPRLHRKNLTISIILQRKKGDIQHLNYVLKSFFKILEEADISQVCNVISTELKNAGTDDDIRTILYIIPANYWDRLDQAVRIKTEKLLFERVNLGRINSFTGKCRGGYGALENWVTAEHLEKFENTKAWTSLVVNKMKSSKVEEKAYVEKFYWKKICKINRDDIDSTLKEYLQNGLRVKDQAIVKKVEFEIMFEESHPWWKVFEEELKDFPEIKHCDLYV